MRKIYTFVLALVFFIFLNGVAQRPVTAAEPATPLLGTASATDPLAASRAALIDLGNKLIEKAIPGAVLPETHPLKLRMIAGADAVVAEVAYVYGGLSLAEQDRRARIAFVFAWYESGLQADPKGSNDKNQAHGAMQVHILDMPKGILPADLTPAKVRGDLRLGIRAGLLVMRYLEGQCGGSLLGAMTAYATGSCPKQGWSIPIVVRRFTEAGVKNK